METKEAVATLVVGSTAVAAVSAVADMVVEDMVAGLELHLPVLHAPAAPRLQN